MNLSPAFPRNNIPIFVASSSEYLPYCGVCLKAIIDLADEHNNYDIVVIGREIPPLYEEKFHDLTRGRSNISIRYYDVSALLSDKNFPLTYSISITTHVRIETFYRLFVPFISAKYKKVLYLDIDVVPLEDVAHIYKIDIGKSWIAGCQDYGIMKCYVSHKLFKNYFDNELQLNPFSEYVNGGVLLYNVKELNSHQIAQQWIQEAQATPHLFFDQDVINKVCHGHIMFIDSEWNDTNQANTEGIPRKYIRKRLRDKKTHRLVHWCTNYRKPWIDPSHETGHIWWEVARRTPFYEEILYRNIKAITEKEFKEKIEAATKNVEDTKNLVRSLKDIIEKRDIKSGTEIAELLKQLSGMWTRAAAERELQQMKKTMKEVAQLGDYRRKLKRVRWKAHLSWGKRKQRYLARKKQLKEKILSIEKFIKTK